MIFLFISCTSDIKSIDSTSPVVDQIGILRREDGWLRGDLHIHSTYSDGYDDVITNINIAEYLANETFLSAHPEYTGNGLDFISLTDHRTVAQQSDLDYVSSELILINGEEFGDNGHAGVHGIQEMVEQDPGNDGTTLDDILNAVISTREQGGTFSPNHPFLPIIPFPWDIEDHDGIEIWNSGWALMSPEMTLEKLDEWEAENGSASPTYKRAVQTTGQLASMQALTWYEARLSRGHHAALIGGSDRHTVLPIGFPTTWIHTDSFDESGIIKGIQERRSFISRTPVSAQLKITVDVNGNSYQMGDEIPLNTVSTATIRVQIGRAEGGLIRVRYGSAVDSDEALATAELGIKLQEESILSDDHSLEWSQEVAPGDWFYPIVLEPLVVVGSTEEQAEEIRSLARSVADTGGEDFLGLITLFSMLVENEVLFDGSKCNPEQWKSDQLQCLPPDDESLGSFFVPDQIDRALNVYVENNEITQWSMGAIGSAVLFVDQSQEE